MKNLGLRVAGVVAVGMISILIFLQIEIIKMGLSGQGVPDFFYMLIDFFAVAIFLLGLGCIYKNLSGVGVVFASFQMFLLVSLVGGMPPIEIIIGIVLVSIIYLDISQKLVFISEICEPTLPTPLAPSEREKVYYYIKGISYTTPDAVQKLQCGKHVWISQNWIRLLLMWLTVTATLILAILFVGNDPVYYIAILFFVVFPMTIIALALQRRRKEED